MGKRKTREPEITFQISFESLKPDFEQANKLRCDLWLTTVKQCKLIKLLRNLIPDSNNSDARNLIQEFTDRARNRVEQLEDLLQTYLDRSIYLYKRRRLN